jgi:hypothetical protein
LYNGIFLYAVIFAGEVVYLPKDVSIPITMKSREYEVFTVVPMKELPNGVKFAPTGLIKMFNSGGSVKEFSYGMILMTESVINNKDEPSLMHTYLFCACVPNRSTKCNKITHAEVFC